MSRFRKVKKDVRSILGSDDWRERLSELEQWTTSQLVAPLFSLRLDKEEDIRWRSIVAFGTVAGRMAQSGMDKARVLMRTFMWYMNEESGNLGWGIPESMAEAMCADKRLADEFSSILASYVFCDEECDGNYLDHPELRRGVFWGLGRLGVVYPEYVLPHARFIVAALKDGDAWNRGLAAWTLGILNEQAAADGLRSLLEDGATVRIFRNDVVEEVPVSQLAREALARLDS